MVRRFVHIDSACKEDVPAHADLRGIRGAVVDARRQHRIVETDDRIVFFLKSREELGEVVFRPGEIHFVEADDVHFSGCFSASMRSSASPVSAGR